MKYKFFFLSLYNHIFIDHIFKIFKNRKFFYSMDLILNHIRKREREARKSRQIEHNSMWIEFIWTKTDKVGHSEIGQQQQLNPGKQ